jgi:enoyl-CoA hydratase/carnithine racemase
VLNRAWTDGQIGHVRLTRPEKRNALDRAAAVALRAAIAEVTSDSNVRCLILSGAGPSFSAGGDLKSVLEQTVAETLQLNAEVIGAVDDLIHLPIPSIVMLHGHVLGAGLELALGCTLRVASADALLGLPEVRVGLLPASGGVARLPRLIPRGAAARLLLTGDIIGADEALSLGLVDIVTPAASLLEQAVVLAERIAANAPLAVRAVREIMAAEYEPAVRATLDLASEQLASLLASEDLREGVAAFSERRTPAFTGR